MKPHSASKKSNRCSHQTRTAMRLPLALLAGGALIATTALALQQDEPPAFSHAPLNAILQATVNADGLVDYQAIQRDHAAALDQYLAAIAAADVDALARDAQLALYINLYNAAMLDIVVDRIRPDYSVAENDFAVFDAPLLRVRGQQISLNHLEHEIIRKEFQEPRIHAAIVCASKSCPKLRNTAWVPERLGDQLNAAMRDFLTDPRRNKIAPDGRRLQLSKIFEWFAEDFGGAENLPVYTDKFVPQKTRGAQATFLDYSWQLNRQ